MPFSLSSSASNSLSGRGGDSEADITFREGEDGVMVVSGGDELEKRSEFECVVCNANQCGNFEGGEGELEVTMLPYLAPQSQDRKEKALACGQRWRMVS